MPLLFVGIGIAILLILMLVLKFDPFFALLITAVAVGLLNSMELATILKSIIKGVGDTMGNIVLIIAFGAMLGKLIEVSGAAYTITYRLTSLFGIKYIQFALLITGFLVGLPMMYNAGFLVLIPLLYTFAATTKLPLLYLGIPLCATLSIAHGYLPPHPAPTYISFVYNADINLVLVFGLIAMVPACLIAGIMLSRFFPKIKAEPPAGLFEYQEFKQSELPKLSVSILAAAMPVILMMFGATIDLIFGKNTDYAMGIAPYCANESTVSFLINIIKTVKFISDPNVALMLSVLVAIYLLGVRRGKKMEELTKTLSKSVGAIAMIILIIAAGGAFKQVLADSPVDEYIKEKANNISLNPLILAWGIAAIIRFAIGSATVATMTAAGIMLPIISSTGVSPELMVLATGSGSLMFSHFNDTGFWMFKEYFNVSIKQTLTVWTTMECIIGTIGLLMALLLDVFF